MTPRPTRPGTRTKHGLFVYGIVPADLEPPSLTGVADARVATVRHGRVAAVVGPVALDRPAARAADLRAYHCVVGALSDVGPIAPARFGSVVLDEEQVVEEVLAPREEELSELLEALRGRVEVTVRARYVEDVVVAEVVAAHPRIRDLSERSRDVPEEVSWGDRVHLGELIADAVEAQRVREAEDLLALLLDHVLETALLVDEDELSLLEQRVEDYAESVQERVRVSLTGPLPPYSFVGETGARAAGVPATEEGHERGAAGGSDAGGGRRMRRPGTA